MYNIYKTPILQAAQSCLSSRIQLSLKRPPFGRFALGLASLATDQRRLFICPAKERRQEMELSNRQRLFVQEYLSCWNASEAARRAGYKGKANVIGSRLMTYGYIQEAVQQKIAKISDDEADNITRKTILDLPLVRKRGPANKVYFIQAKNGLVKIGIANNVYLRLESLNTASPVDLNLLFWIETNEARKLESSFHNIFRSKHIKGEWFNLSPDDIDWVKRNYGIE